MNVKQLLTEKGVTYDVLEHRTTFTAQQLAEAVHVRGDDVAKTVLLKADGEFLLAVLPSTHNIDMKKAKEAVGAKEIVLAAEHEFGKLLPDCELGAVPPFGSKYGLRTLVAEPLTHDEQIVFEGNTHQEAIRMKYADFEKLEKPLVAEFTYHT
jgi:Ala-tRNA(Pro) deacylase